MNYLKIFALLFLLQTNLVAQENNSLQNDFKWGTEVNVLWPIFPGNMYKVQATYEAWRKGHLAGDVFAGIHFHSPVFRENEGTFYNLALTYGYRQFFWRGLHIEAYQAFGPGFNRENVVDGQDYTSWDYEVGLLGGYRWEFLPKATQKRIKCSPYLSTQHGFFYVAAKSHPHPILNQTAERPVYVGTLNLGIKF